MILITGATGRPGSATVQEFIRRRESVRVLVRAPARAAMLASHPTVEVVVGDMLRPDTLAPALSGIDVVLMISSAGPLALETQCTFIDAAKRAGVGRIVKFSGEEAGIDPEKFRSTRNHEQVERYLKASGVPWTMLRPSQFMQVYFEEVPTMLAADQIRLPLGEATLAPVDIVDIAKIAYSLLTTTGHEGRSYSMTGPEALGMVDIARHISAAVGRQIRYVDVSPEDKRREWIAAGYPPERAMAFGQLFAERRALGRAAVQQDTHDRLSVVPTTFTEFAMRNAAVFRGEADYAVTPG